MATDRLFVGREAELARFCEALEDPSGKAILITGPEHMGKTCLARRMLEEVGEGRHPTLTCGAVSYQVTVTDPPEQVMERMIEDAFAVGDAEGSLSASPHRRRQWRTLFRTVVPKGKDLLDLADSLRRERTRPARERLVDLFEKLSDALPEDRRVLFLVDADKHLPAGSHEPWSWVIERLPSNTVLLFTQRPDDALASSASIDRRDQVVSIPEGDLGPLSPEAVEELLQLVPADVGHSFDDLQAHFERLEGHPYAAAAALDLLIEGIPLDCLPVDPGGIAAERKRRDEDKLGPLLTTGAADLPPDPPPSKLLTARYEVVPFEEVGREGELAVLDAWCRDREPGSVLLIHGEGGTGKTRLLIEWCRRLRDLGWRAGFLDRDVDRSQIQSLYEGEAPRLAVIDYGETRPGLVAPALHRLARQRTTSGPKVRMVLLARHADTWWRQLQEDDRLIEDLSLRSPSPIALTPLIPAIEDRPATVARAAEAFAAFHDHEPSEPDEATDYTDARYDRILYLHVDALLQVIGQDDQDDPPLARILSRERATWRRALVSHGISTDPVPDRFRRAADRAMTALTLVRGAESRDDACELIQAAVPNAQGNAVEDLADLFHRLYPSPPGPDSRWIAPLEPDLLGEELVRQVLGQDVELLDRNLKAASERQTRDALVIVGQLLSDETVPVALAQNVFHRIGGDSYLPVSLRDTLARAIQRLLDQHLKEHPDPGEADLAERARLLNALSNSLADLGRLKEALANIEEAVDLCRELCHANRGGFAPQLATSLRNLSRRLRLLRRREEALAAAEESVDMLRDLALVRPREFGLGLARSLNMLSICLADDGHGPKALTAAEESVATYRKFHRKRLKDFGSQFAASLNTLSTQLAALGRWEDALAPIEEAVAIRRELARERPEVFGPDFAMSLNSLGNRLSNVGRREEALAVAKESVTILGGLAHDRSEVFGPDLATSLNNLSNRLADLNRREEALRVSEKAVGTLAPLFSDLPRVFEVRMEKILLIYRKRCVQTNTPPDEALIGPIRETLACLDDDLDSDA